MGLLWCAATMSVLGLPSGNRDLLGLAPPALVPWLLAHRSCKLILPGSDPQWRDFSSSSGTFRIKFPSLFIKLFPMCTRRGRGLFVKLSHYLSPFTKITCISINEEKDQLFPPISAIGWNWVCLTAFPLRCSWIQIIYYQIDHIWSGGTLTGKWLFL